MHFFVSGCLLVVPKRLVTLITLKGPVVIMSFLMSSQIGALWKRLAASVTREGPFSSVHSFMCLQVISLWEWFTAFWARAPLWALWTFVWEAKEEPCANDIRHVWHEKGFSPECTLSWLLNLLFSPNVFWHLSQENLFVCSFMSTLGKIFVTFAAGKRLFVREGFNEKKNVFFRALPPPPPHDPNSGNLVLFFRKSKFKIWKSVLNLEYYIYFLIYCIYAT